MSDRVPTFGLDKQGIATRAVLHWNLGAAPLVEHACSLVHVLGEKLPAPVALTAESWRNNRLLGVAFANPDRMAELVASDERIRHWFREHPLAERAYAILGMSHTVELRYGLEEHNGLVRHDVPQEVLVLRDHLFGEPVGDVHELNRQARLRAMEELANHAARRIQGLETDRKQIEEEINTLRIAIRYAILDQPGVRNLVFPFYLTGGA